jgi:hypothetical protein
MKKTLNHAQLINIEETLKDFKALLSRYREVKDNSDLLKKFLTRNRNPVWDITNNNFFKTGLLSDESKDQSNSKLVDDHFIQRSKAMRFIFKELDTNENMDIDTFIFLLKKYCSTVKLTKVEHIKVTQIAKKNPTYLNYESYLACGIKIDGLSDLILT